jgi:hypothetical protein
VAVTVTVSVVITTPAVAVKLAELAPANTVTVAGIVTKASVSDSVTEVLVETAWLKVTLQEAVAPGPTALGLQPSDVKPTGGPVVIVPPDPVVSMALPFAEVLRALVTLTVVEDVATDSVTVRTATTPFSMTFAFRPLEPNPVRKHV